MHELQRRRYRWGAPGRHRQRFAKSVFRTPAQGLQQNLDKTFTFTAEREEPSLWTAREQPSRRLGTHISKFDGKKADRFLEWSSKPCASLSIYNKSSSTSSKGKNDCRRLATARPPPVGHRMQPIMICSAYCSFRRAAQSSSSYGDSRARHSWTGQGVNS